MRKSLAGKPDPELLTKAKGDIALLKQKEADENIDLFYFDESGYSLTPSVPYGWQDIGVRVKLPSSRSARINVAGFLNPKKNKLVSWVFNGNVDSNVIIAVFDNFALNITKETWIILDNASFHRSVAIEEKIAEWEEKKLFLYYLPPYSPQLNLIERVWQFMKYQWMPLSAYCSFKSLRDAVDSMLDGYGRKHLINFA